MKPNQISQINDRFAALEARVTSSEAQSMTDRARLARSERKLRATWAVSCFAALAMLTIGWHKDAIAQGYGMTLAQAATRIAALETKTASVSAITDPNTSQPTVRFSGVNVQVVNGTNATNGAINGTGNLIIGYNEKGRADFTLGEADTRTGSHNLVVGVLNNYSSFGGLVSGNFNAATNSYAAALGHINTASGQYATVTGGSNNTAYGEASSVSGGSKSTASNESSSVSGGFANTASGLRASVCGGDGNVASGVSSSVSGGYLNTASGRFTNVSGGIDGRVTDEGNWRAGSLFEAE